MRQQEPSLPELGKVGPPRTTPDPQRFAFNQIDESSERKVSEERRVYKSLPNVRDPRKLLAGLDADREWLCAVRFGKRAKPLESALQ